MVNGKSIYDLDNKLLLSANFEITSDILGKLTDRGFNYLYIVQEGTEDVVPEDIVSFSVRLHASNILENIVQEIKKLKKFQNATVEGALTLFDDEYVQKQLAKIVKDDDLTRYIL